MDGELTRDENIADNDGLKKAFYVSSYIIEMEIENEIYSFQAYQKWTQSQKTVEKKLPGLSKYSAEQMFFIRFGQSWCSKVTDAVTMHRYMNDEHAPEQFR